MINQYFSKTVKTIGFIALFIGLFSCEFSSDCCTIIDTDIQVHYQTMTGEDLINSSEMYDASLIRIYYKNGDEYEYIYKSNLTHPNMHNVYEDENGHLILTVFTSYYYENNQSTTLIELNETTVDTLVCNYDLGENKSICTAAWLNGVAMDGRYLNVKK